MSDDPTVEIDALTENLISESRPFLRNKVARILKAWGEECRRQMREQAARCMEEHEEQALAEAIRRLK